MSLIPDITPEQIDDWFRIGKKTAKIKSIPRSITGGSAFNPETQLPTVPKHQHVPSYKRQLDTVQDYALEYQRLENENLISRAAAMLDGSGDTASVISSHLETLDSDSTVAGTEVPPIDIPENATHVYGVYNFHHYYDDKLPIVKCRLQVVNTIESNMVTVIQGATGSGKTTQVAQYILDHYAQMNKYCNIIVTQPRRIAAISIASRVCQERNWQLGTICGYQVALDKVASEDTRILYCTTGILLNKLINEKNMNQYTHVILDEVHERDQDTDFCLLVVRKLLHSNSRSTRIILMSATFESDMFAHYFAMPVLDRLEQAPVVNVDGKPFKVLEFYVDDLSQLGEVPRCQESDPHIVPEAQSLAVRLIEQFDVMEEKEQGSSETGIALVRGTVLVFLPGLAEILNLEEELNKLRHKHQLTLIPLHSSITMEEQAQVFSTPSPGFRKVILSTNIAESSITVPDIKYVIDFCLTKKLVCDFDTNYTSLQVHWAAKANCIQRKGRAGRVSNGRVYRLVPKHFYDTVLPDYGVPEMQRCPLDKLILQVKVLDLGEPKAILALAISPPNLNDIERNVIMLKEVGALSMQTAACNPYDGDLTFLGRVLADLPVDIKVGKLLMLGHVFGLLEECLIIGAAMSLKSIFAQPFKLRLEAYRHKLEWAAGSQSDSIAILNAYRLWERKRDRGEFKRSGGGGEPGWCKQHYMQIRRLKEVAELVKDMEKRLVKFNICKPQHEPNYRHKLTDDQEKLLLKVVLSGAFYPNYFVRQEIDEMESLKSLSGRNPLNTIMVKGLPPNQGTLYKQAVEDMFRKCEYNPQAYFEETRAYIEFPWRSHRSKVHEGVYMALKMKQLRIPLTLNLYTEEEAASMLQKIEEAQNNVSKLGQLKTNRMTTSQDTKEVGTGRTVTYVDMPCAAKTVFTLSVTEVIDCGHFWAQYGEDENYKALSDVQEALNREGGHSLKPLVVKTRVGMFCAAPYMDENMHYYRARIDAVNNKYDQSVRANREFVEVFFVDYGNSMEMVKEELRELPSYLLKIPFQAIECKQIKLRPSPLKCPDGKWTAEAREAFKKLTMNHTLLAKAYSVVHGVLRLELIRVVGQEQNFIAMNLYEMGFADEAEESLLSKQNHEERLEEIHRLGHLSIEEQYLKSREKKSDWLQVSLDSAAQAVDVGARHRGSKVTLSGPSNPFEMSFQCLNNVGTLRSTRIDPESVNSICIDDAPHDPHQRLMVAGFVGLNPNGSSMIARDTTIMPQIPGLLSIVTLLFTPVAEFRVDSKKSRYIGAICGLGTVPNSNNAMLPDHDIELPFDVQVDHEDIFKINGVRMAINFAIGSQNSVAAWGPDAVYKIQDHARQKIMNLIQKRRESCTVENPCHSYQWNQIDPDDILPHTVDIGDTTTLLELHSGIQLQGDAQDDILSTDKKKYLIEHVNMLRQVLKSPNKKTQTLCELCQSLCPTPQLLAIHMETQNHKRLEQNLFL